MSEQPSRTYDELAEHEKRARDVEVYLRRTRELYSSGAVASRAKWEAEREANPPVFDSNRYQWRP